MFCKNCGKEISDGTKFCPECGATQEASVVGSPSTEKDNSNQTANCSQKSRTVTALFAFFLGGLGIHRFYVGKTGTGILQILLTWDTFGHSSTLLLFFAVISKTAKGNSFQTGTQGIKTK